MNNVGNVGIDNEEVYDTESGKTVEYLDDMSEETIGKLLNSSKSNEWCEKISQCSILTLTLENKALQKKIDRNNKLIEKYRALRRD